MHSLLLNSFCIQSDRFVLRMVRRSQKTKNRMIDEVHWMQRKCAEIEKKEGQVREALDRSNIQHCPTCPTIIGPVEAKENAHIMF